jgi:hypothetical protein
MLSFVGGGHIFFSMRISGLSLQTTDVKTSLVADSILFCFRHLFRGIKYFDIIFLLGLSVLQKLIFLSFRLSNKSSDEEKLSVLSLCSCHSIQHSVAHRNTHKG